jgi:hypothetical protein
VDALKDDSYIGIALQASWESSASVRFSKLNPNPQRFLGFLEGRTRLRVPLQWEVGLITEVFRDDQKLVNSSLKCYLPIAAFLKQVDDGSIMDVSEPFSEAPLGVWVPPGTRLKMVGNKITVSVGAESVIFPKELLERLRKTYDIGLLKAVLGPERSYIALYAGPGRSFPLLCLDSHSGKVIWKTESWGYGEENYRGVAGSLFRHELEIVLTDNTIALFGEGNGGCYLDVFDQKTGTSLYRFSTSYWRMATP